MTRAERKRLEKQKAKETKIYHMTLEQLETMRLQEYERARQEILKNTADTATEIFNLMLMIPTNVLIEYWPKSAKKRIPKFAQDCLNLYSAWVDGTVDIDEMLSLTEQYTGLKLVRDNSSVDRAIQKQRIG